MECRICRGIASAAAPLYSPCKCTGSVQYCHQDCLTDWLDVSGNDKCELCGSTFLFEPKYRSDMPQTLPFSIILRGIALLFMRFALIFFRNMCVLSIWLIMVPLLSVAFTRYILEATFPPTLELWLVDWLDGLRFSGILIAILMCGLALLDHVSAQIKRVEDERLLLAEELGKLAWDDEANVQSQQNRDDNQEREQVMAEVADDVNNDDGAAIINAIGLNGPVLNALINSMFLLLANIIAIVLLLWLPEHLGKIMSPELPAEHSDLFQDIVALLAAKSVNFKYGYLVICVIFLLIPTVMIQSSIILREISALKNYVNYAYLISKIIFLSLIELLLFPALCGILVNIFLLPLFISDGVLSTVLFWKYAPKSAGFVHWFIGTIVMLLFASLFSFLQKYVRPGCLWFIRNPHDDETFNPVQEMLEQTLGAHLRKIIASFMVYSLFIVCVFGSVTLLVLTSLPMFTPLRFPFQTSESAWGVILLTTLIPTAIQSVKDYGEVYQKYLLFLLFFLSQRFCLLSFFFGGRWKSDETNAGVFRLVLCQNDIGRQRVARYFSDSYTILAKLDRKRLEYVENGITLIKISLPERPPKWNPFRTWRDLFFYPVADHYLLEKAGPPVQWFDVNKVLKLEQKDNKSYTPFPVRIVIEEIDGPVINALATVVFTPSSFSWRLKKLIFSFIMLGVFSHVAFLVAILIAGYIFREAAENSISLAGRGLIVISLFRWFSRVLVSGQVKDYWRLAVFVVFGFILVPYSLGLWINLWLVHKYSTFQSVWGVGFAHYYMLLLIVQLASSRELRPWPMTYINRQTIRQSAVDMIEALENLQHLRFPRASIVFRDFILPMASAVGILRYLPRLYILVAHLFLLASMIYCSKRILLIEKIRKSEYLIGRQLRNYF